MLIETKTSFFKIVELLELPSKANRLLKIIERGAYFLGVVQKKRVEVTMANPYLEGMELLIKDGLYESQAEIVKDALRRLFVHYEIQLITDVTIDS